MTPLALSVICTSAQLTGTRHTKATGRGQHKLWQRCEWSPLHFYLASTSHGSHRMSCQASVPVHDGGEQAAPRSGLGCRREKRWLAAVQEERNLTLTSHLKAKWTHFKYREACSCLTAVNRQACGVGAQKCSRTLTKRFLARLVKRGDIRTRFNGSCCDASVHFLRSPWVSGKRVDFVHRWATLSTSRTTPSAFSPHIPFAFHSVFPELAGEGCPVSTPPWCSTSD